jgi:hypothetical protein
VTRFDEALSYAVCGNISHRFVTAPSGVSPGRIQTLANLRAQMISLGYDPYFTGTTGDSPTALGKRVAQSVNNYNLFELVALSTPRLRHAAFSRLGFRALDVQSIGRRRADRVTGSPFLAG